MIETRYTEDHEWVQMDDDGVAIVGISDYAQEQLGDLVYIELPEVGQDVTQGEEIGVIESVKTAGELISPLTGTIVAVNEELTESPEIVNRSPLDDGWFVKIKPVDDSELADLMDEDAYAEYVGTLA